MLFHVYDVDVFGCQANEEDDSDDDDEYDEAEETALESYETPLDKDDCPVDEFNIFKTLISSEFSWRNRDYLSVNKGEWRPFFIHLWC